MISGFYFLMIIGLAFSAKLSTAGQSDTAAGDSTDFNKRLYSEGVSFYATGNEPFWSLRVNRDGTMSFDKMSEFTINTGPVRVSKAMDADVKRLDAEGESGSLSVSIYRQECTDDMSGNKFSFRVEVNAVPSGGSSAATYSGCGRYIPDQSLNGKWMLKMIGSDEIVATAYGDKVPFLEIDVNEMRVSGIAGCNRINGPLLQEDGYMRFDRMASTLMACPEQMREADILKGLNSTTQYKIENEMLILSNPDNTTLVYQRASDVETGSTETQSPEQLEGTWVLESTKGNPVNAEGYMKGKPRLIFFTADKKYSGSNGCNNLMGKYEADAISISFGPAGMTKMACPGNYEQEFVRNLETANRWKLEGDRLKIYEGDVELMVFVKN
ncbi:MAG: META domain-containing protein [Ignavibacteria bacterium]|nr:META domain-containing protein [Ignavibacteria bacterium]